MKTQANLMTFILEMQNQAVKHAGKLKQVLEKLEPPYVLEGVIKMSNQKKKKLTPTQQEYQTFAKAKEPKRPLLSNLIRAFIMGGIICTIGQGIQTIFIAYFKFTEVTAGNPTVAVMIIISVLLTGFWVYDRLAQWSGAGTAVPVTGFANSIAAAAIEHRSEGFVLGVAGKMFKLAGAVIVYGYWRLLPLP